MAARNRSDAHQFHRHALRFFAEEINAEGQQAAVSVIGFECRQTLFEVVVQRWVSRAVREIGLLALMLREKDCLGDHGSLTERCDALNGLSITALVGVPRISCAEPAQERTHCSFDFLDAPPAAVVDMTNVRHNSAHGNTKRQNPRCSWNHPRLNR